MSGDIDNTASSIVRLAISSVKDGNTVETRPAYMKFTWLDGWIIFLSLMSYLIEYQDCIAVAVTHYLNKDLWYFGLTLTFMCIPNLVMTVISYCWYVLDARKDGSPEVTDCQWTVRKIFSFLQSGPTLRYIDSLIYGCRSCLHEDILEKKKNYHYMVYENTNATKLRLFGCFMGSAPQLVLQIYILAVLKSLDGYSHWRLYTQINACAALLLSLPWSLVSYQHCSRRFLPNKVSLTWKGIAVQLLWRFYVIAARVLALALFATIYNRYISIVCGVHWIIMFVWIVSMKTSLCKKPCEGLGGNAVLAIMYIFCYIDPVDSPTRYRYAIYYTFMFCENTLLMTLWFTKAEPDLWYRIPALVGHYTSFFLGLLFMVAYYLSYHPSKSRKLEINQDETERIQD